MHDNYLFGVDNGMVPTKVGDALDEIAREYGGEFYSLDLPTGPAYWFSIPSRGLPFDIRTAVAILKKAKLAGLWPVSPRPKSSL